VKFSHAFAAAALGLLVMAQAPAPAPPAGPQGGGPRRAETAAAPGAAPAAAPQGLPAESVTHHELALSGRHLAFTAIAGSVRLADAQGAPQADLATLGYVLDGADPATRPVTFVVNGGPGASSAWLQLGALGPWRVRMDGAAAAPSAPVALLPNDDTWLDATDLVFIDPVSTGFSKFLASGDEVRKRLWSVDGDIAALAETMRLWLEAHHRMAAPKYLVGESYGGFRGPRLVRELAQHQGIGVRGLVLVSPVLDFGARSTAFDLIGWAELLPSETAAARAGGGPVDRASLADVEAYAQSEFLTALIKGESDPAALKAMEARVAGFTGLPADLVSRRHGRISSNVFLNEQHAAQSRVGSIYDATTTEADPFPAAIDAPTPDPVLDALAAPMTAAMLELYGSQLAWQPQGTYQLLNNEVARQWDYHWGRRGPQSMSALREALSLDPALRVVVVHGLYDLVTPYFRDVMLLNQIAATAGADRVKLLALPGGHMVYRDDASRAALRAAGLALMP